MAALPEQVTTSKTVAAIYAAYKAREKPRFSRRLGASIIGQECSRRIWYSFRWSGREDFDGRLLRLFDTGHLEESRFVADLRAIGCEVWDHDDATGQQWEYTAISGHIIDKLDAVAIGIPDAPKTPHVCEFKTHSAKSFGVLASKGLKLAKPEHYAQVIIGMALSGLTRGLYLAVNKDTDELYAERLRWEQVKDEAGRLLEFAKSVITADRAPARAGKDAEAFICKWCPFKGICHGTSAPIAAVPIPVTCRSCVHATAVIEDGDLGRWTCARHKKTLDLPMQERACADHLLIPDYITFAEMQDGGDEPAGGWIEYKNSDGNVWRQGKRTGQYKTIELTQLPAVLVGADGLVNEVKKVLGGEVVEVVNG